MTKQVSPELLAPGRHWQDLSVGQRFRTLRRTLTEPDLVNFIGVTGMLEAIFIDADYQGGAISGRPVPATLTFAIIEGMIFQTLIQGTGLAMLELAQKIVAPVLVGDTVDALIEVKGVRPTSKGNRAVVTAQVDIFNQRGEQVMTYTATRLLAGRSLVVESAVGA